MDIGEKMKKSMNIDERGIDFRCSLGIIEEKLWQPNIW